MKVLDCCSANAAMVSLGKKKEIPFGKKKEIPFNAQLNMDVVELSKKKENDLGLSKKKENDLGLSKKK